MSIDERARLSLYQRLGAVLGALEADTLMSYLPPQGWGEVATKGDLALLRADFDSFRREMRAELVAELSAVRVELHRGQRGVVLSLVAVMVALAAGQMAILAAMM
jgi:hypothetical protein